MGDLFEPNRSKEEKTFPFLLLVLFRDTEHATAPLCLDPTPTQRSVVLETVALKPICEFSFIILILCCKM